MLSFRNFSALQTARLRNQTSMFPRRAHDKGMPVFAEHFENWALIAPDSLTDIQRMRDAAVNTGWVHHQLCRNGKVRQFARSTSTDTSSLHDVHALIRSPLARKIDVAFKWLRKQETPKESTVRLLFVPADRSFFLWLVAAQADYFVLADGPRYAGQCAYKHLYDLAAFKEKLLMLVAAHRTDLLTSNTYEVVDIPAVGIAESSEAR